MTLVSLIHRTWLDKYFGPARERPRAQRHRSALERPLRSL